jgi:hypothetical protein
MRPSTRLTALAAFSTLSFFHPQQSRSPDFRPLEFLVGHCWVGTFPAGKATDQHCFEWVFDQKFIRDRHVVRNGDAPYAGETLYGWDPKERRLGFWYWNSEGEMLTGTVEYRPGAIVFPTTHVTDKGTVELRATWTRRGQDGYRVEQSQRVGDEWKPLWTMELKQTSGAAQ